MPKEPGSPTRAAFALEGVKEWGRIWAIGFVLWTVLAFLSAAGAHVYTASVGSPESWAQLLAWNITISFVWSLLTPPVYMLARRFTFDRSNWKSVLPLHIAASVALTFLAASIIVWLEPLVTWTPEAHLPFFAHMLSRAFMDFQRYWYILLITQAIGYYGKYRERELQSSQLEAQLALRAARSVEDPAGAALPVQHPEFDCRPGAQRRSCCREHDAATGRPAAFLAGRHGRA